MPCILITEPVDELLPNSLKANGFEVVHQPDIQRAEVLATIDKYVGLIINSKIVADKELLDMGTQLKFVARCGSGKEVMDISYATEHSITCITSPEGNKQAVAEQGLGMLLSIMNNIHSAYNEVLQHKWIREANRGNELSGKTVGIVGYGHTGEAFAKVLSGFNVTVLAHDKYRKNFGENYIKEVTLNEIYQQADVVSLHLPLTEETHYYANATFFQSFKNPIWFLNTSRGVCVDTKALINAIENHSVIAAATDVLENEKINSLNADEQAVFEQLITIKKVLVTPHIAGWTYESKRKIAEVLLQKILQLNLMG